jgi:hypothetical protein
MSFFISKVYCPYKNNDLEPKHSFPFVLKKVFGVLVVFNEALNIIVHFFFPFYIATTHSSTLCHAQLEISPTSFIVFRLQCISFSWGALSDWRVLMLDCVIDLPDDV